METRMKQPEINGFVTEHKEGRGSCLFFVLIVLVIMVVLCLLCQKINAQTRVSAGLMPVVVLQVDSVDNSIRLYNTFSGENVPVNNYYIKRDVLYAVEGKINEVVVVPEL